MLVVVDIGLKVCHFHGKRLLPIYFLMYGVSRMLGMQRKYLGSPPRRRKQNDRTTQGRQCPHQCPHQRRLSRASIALEQKNIFLMDGKKKITPFPDHFQLFFRRRVGEFIKD